MRLTLPLPKCVRCGEVPVKEPGGECLGCQGKNHKGKNHKDKDKEVQVQAQPQIHPNHSGKLVMVEKRMVMVGSSRYIGEEMQDWATAIIPLNAEIPWGFRNAEFLPKVIWQPLVDYGGVPEYWREFVEWVWSLIRTGERVGFWCTGGHGRTGTMLASLIAIAEPDKDPIREARERGCEKMVETLAQLKAVAKLLPEGSGKPLVKKWAKGMKF